MITPHSSTTLRTEEDATNRVRWESIHCVYVRVTQDDERVRRICVENPLVAGKRSQHITINATTWSYCTHLTRGGRFVYLNFIIIIIVIGVIIIIIIIKIIHLQYLSLPICPASSLPPDWLFVVSFGVAFLLVLVAQRLTKGKFV